MKNKNTVLVKHNLAGLILLLAMGAGFGVNALLMQKDKHPAPLLASSSSGDKVNEIRLSPAAEPQTALKKDPLVIAVQSGLRDMKLYQGAIDGIAGGETKRSILAYQELHGLERNGKINTALVSHMRAQSQNNAPTLAAPQLSQPVSVAAPANKPAQGVDSIALLINEAPAQFNKPVMDETVRTLQEKLKQAGYDPGPVDGMFGGATARALRAFQEANGLPVTGQVDADLLVQLFSAVEGRASNGG